MFCAGGLLAMSGGVPCSRFEFAHFVDQGSEEIIALIVSSRRLGPLCADRVLKLGELHSCSLLSSNQLGCLLPSSNHRVTKRFEQRAVLRLLSRSVLLALRLATLILGLLPPPLRKHRV